MEEYKVFKQSDLVLKVNKNYNPKVLDLDEWEEFLDILCGDRDYQKQAIRTAVIYLASKRYNNLSELVKENYKVNLTLQDKYSDLQHYYKYLQIKDKLFANLDIATGAGKSYIMYGIGQILLGIGIINKVLVLCPSLTIEDSLKSKFLELSSSDILKKCIPDSAIYKNPRIIDASVSIVNGDICIENVHAIYANTDSSIHESILSSGENVLVLNDESHHIFYNKIGNSENEKNIKKWKEFIINSDYNFKYVLGFTGTAYYENEYFNDVIFRYSLRKAIEDKIIKNVEYVREDDSGSEPEKFQKIYQNHQDNRKRYSKINPLTIMVTKDINQAKKLYNKLIDFLIEADNLEKKDVEKKILIVTSAREHARNLLLLKHVDNKDESSVEWIISVSMLTEGWDVKNVFQIVPWEDRAFNSKLLIAQVLGRGLRIPNEYQSPQPKVTVFNHDSWSKNIVNLISEVLEIETKIYSSPIKSGERNNYNFNLYNLSYNHEEKEVPIKQESNFVDFTRIEREGIKLDSQIIVSNKSTEFATINDDIIVKKYDIVNDTITIDEVLDKLYDDFKQRDWEGKVLKLSTGDYTQNILPSRLEIEKIIRKSMLNVGIEGDLLIEKNQYKILSAFNVLIRKKKKSVTSNLIFCDTFQIESKNIDKASIGIGNLKRGYSIFFTDEWKNEVIDENTKVIMEKVLKDESWPISAIKEKNQYTLKTPVDILITNFEPERKFVEALCEKENAKMIDAWIKSRDKGFYSIEYAYKYGDINSKTRKYTHKTFNPDFFIKIKKDDMDYIFVVEIKADKDVSRKNIAKYKYGINHFEALNKILKEKNIKQTYLFHFLSPNGYPEFFEYLHNGKLFESQDIFRCELENMLLEEN